MRESGQSDRWAAITGTQRQGPARVSRGSRGLTFRILRVALPTVAGLLLLVAVLWPQLFPGRGRVGVEVATVERTEDGDDTITDATYSGVDGQGRPFSISAKRVRNAPEQPQVLLMVDPDAQMVLRDGTQVTIAATNGTYDRAAEHLALHGDVRLTHGPGVTVRTEQANIDLAAGSALGKEPVLGTASFGTVSGLGFRVVDRGNVIFVGGPATLVIDPAAEPRLP